MVGEGNAFGLAAIHIYEMMTPDVTDTSKIENNDRNIVTIAAATSPAWPYSACSGILDRKLAESIRAWALSRMSQAELHSYSQRQLLSMYLEHIFGQHLKEWPRGCA